MWSTVFGAIKAVAELIGKLIPGKKKKVPTLVVEETWRKDEPRIIVTPEK